MKPTHFENFTIHIVFVYFDLKSSEMLRRIDWQTATDVSKALRSSKRRRLFTSRYGVTSQKAWILNNIMIQLTVFWSPPPCCPIRLILLIYFITGYQTLFVPISCAFKTIAYPTLMKSAQCLLIRLLKRSSSMVNLLPASFIISVGPNRYRNSVPWEEPTNTNTFCHVICSRGSGPLRTNKKICKLLRK